MAEVNKKVKNIIELKKELGDNGVGMENVYINGVKAMAIGYSSDKDKQKCLDAIQAAVNNSDSLSEAMKKLQIMANLGDKEVSPDKQVDINGYVAFVSYKDKTLYDTNGDPVVDCKDLDVKLPDEAIEALLIARAKAL